MAGDGQVPVLASTQAGFAFLTGHWTKFLPGAVLSALGAFIFAQGLAAGTAGAAAIGLAAMFATDLVYRAALFRFALHGEYAGMFGMRLSEDEGRLAGVTALYALFAGLVLITAGAVALVVVVGVAGAAGDLETLQAAAEAAGSTQAQPQLSAATNVAFTLGMLAVTGLMIFVAMRLCLYAPATIAERRIVLLESWPWTRDSFWRLLAALVLAAAPGMALQYLFVGLASGAVAAGAGALAGVLTLAGALGGALVSGMMIVGVLAFLYRGLRPPATDAA